MRKRIIILLITMSFPVLANAQNTESFELSIGQKSNISQGLLRTDTSEFLNAFEEKYISASYSHEIDTYVSIYGKFLHYNGKSNAKHVWDRYNQQWQKLDGNHFSTHGNYFGGGFEFHTNQDNVLSASVFFGYGYLDNPDNMLNSGHGQFNFGTSVHFKLHQQWSLTATWEHLSNGRQMFKLGDYQSDYYPNNGRDFVGLGLRYDFM